MKLDSSIFPEEICLAYLSTHPSWHACLASALQAMHAEHPGYFSDLCKTGFLPTNARIFAAFSRPMSEVRYILVGEGPYPREDSATGMCFMDGAVNQIWADDGSGLSKKVNRATSLRNFIKMLLVANSDLNEESTTGVAMAEIAAKAQKVGSGYIQNLPELQTNLLANGFLLLNATLVYREEVSPLKDGRAWLSFLHQLLSFMQNFYCTTGKNLPTLVLWGKVAKVLQKLSFPLEFPVIQTEHPYNLSFIKNEEMQDFFAGFKLLDAVS